MVHVIQYTAYSVVVIVLSLLQEESQALQAVTMLDMYIKIHVEYTELKNLERCFRPKTYELNFKRSELLRKIAKLKSALVSCSYIVIIVVFESGLKLKSTTGN